MLIVRRGIALLEPVGDFVGLARGTPDEALCVVVVDKLAERNVGSEDGVTDRDAVGVGRSEDEDPGRVSADVRVSGMRDRVLETGKGGRGMLGGLPGDGGGICRRGGE